ncbi:MAG: hypothetical protein QM212_00135 [Bacteroidota bacterium]|nr:hypothetical protein [Bacteroidota bacterium]
MIVSGINTIKTNADSLAKKAKIRAKIENSKCWIFLLSKYFMAHILDIMPNIKLRISSLFFKLSTTSVCMACVANNRTIKKDKNE